MSDSEQTRVTIQIRGAASEELIREWAPRLASLRRELDQLGVRVRLDIQIHWPIEQGGA